MEKFEAVVIAIAVISSIYWLAFSVNFYNIFHEFNDLGYFASSMWYFINYHAAVGGLQSIIFANHITPVQLLVLPFFYIYQSALTLLFVQDVFLALSGIVVFYISRDLLKSNFAALFLFLAFMMNPGTHGMLAFDYHAEAFITAFYILCFYFYMKHNTKLFLVSLVLLLGTMETVPIIVVALGVGLLLYSLVYTDDKMAKREEIKLAVVMIAASVATLVAYSAITQSLTASYASGQYQSLPPYLQVLPIAQNQIAQGGNFSIALAIQSLDSPVLVYGILLVLFGFGFAILFDPLISVILLIPWIVQSMYIGYTPFLLIYYQYFGFSLGPIIVAVILGLTLMKKRKGLLASRLSKALDSKTYSSVCGVTISSVLVFSAVFFMASPVFIKSANLNNLQEDFLFVVGPAHLTNITSLNSVVAQVPQNSSLMTTYFAYSHLFQRRQIELLGNLTYYFKPKYILVDFNDNISVNVDQAGQQEWFNQFMQDNAGNYTISAMNGTAILYKEIS